MSLNIHAETVLAALGITTDEADDDGEAAKPRDITKAVDESAALASLKKEIDGCKDGTDLCEWAEKVKARKLAERLNDEEHALLRRHYQARLRAIMDAPDDEPVKPKKKGGAE